MLLSQVDGSFEYCQFETFQPRCWKNEVILMTSSVYGRMSRSSRCIKSTDHLKEEQRYWGCSADVLRLTDSRSSGRRDCDIRLPDPQFHRTNPCGTTDIALYLEASFECVVGNFLYLLGLVIMVFSGGIYISLTIIMTNSLITLARC